MSPSQECPFLFSLATSSDLIDPMSFNFHDMTAQHSTGLHFAGFGEPVTCTTNAGDGVETTGIIKVTEQAESSDDGNSVIVRAELVIPAKVDREDIGIRSTWKLTFRGQTFAIESLSPPAAGFIKVNAIAERKEVTRPAALRSR